MTKKILILVDVQNDFCPGGALAVSEGDQIIPTIKQLLREVQYDLVVATQDWHPAEHGSFAANHSGKSPFEMGELKGIPQTLWPEHCVQNSVGAEFHPDLLNDPEFERQLTLIVQKGLNPEVDSYSAFYDNQRLGETGLRSFLEQYATVCEVEPEDLELHFAGLALDYCVKFSVLDARELGYQCKLLLDATRAVNLSPNDDLKTLRELIEHGVEVLSSAELIQHDRQPVRTVERVQGHVQQLNP
jgi:nicotinamidase/pyrazinamidase